jgi:threonine dehydrogenase-like Zn-dependent dehydrogenase
VAARRELARQAGADAVLDPSAIDPSREILRDTGGRGVDVAIDCAATGGSTNHCLRATRNAGRVVITGIPVEREVRWNSRRCAARSWRSTPCAGRIMIPKPRAICWPATCAVCPMITHTRPLERSRKRSIKWSTGRMAWASW